jgi:hypothetical protein
VLFPSAQVQTSVEQTQTPHGPIARNGTYVDLAQQGAGYYIWQSPHPYPLDAPDDQCKVSANAAATALASALNGRVESTTEKAVANRKGVVYVITGTHQGEKTRLQILYLMTRVNFYQVQCIDGKTLLPQADVDRFMSSFSIME